MAGFGTEILIYRGPTTVTDQSTAGNDGTLIGGLTTTADTGSGGSVAFLSDGSGDYMQSPDPFRVTADKWFGIWFKSTAISANHQILFDNRSLNTTNRTVLYLRNAAPLGMFTTYGDGTNFVTVNGVTDFRADNTWHLAVMNIAFGDTFSVYLDGVLAGSADCSSVVAQAANPNMVVGCGYSGTSTPFNAYSFSGVWDDARIGAGQLTPTQVAAWWSAGRGYNAPTTIRRQQRSQQIIS